MLLAVFPRRSPLRSAFYLALFLVVGAPVRALSIELRSHVASPLWRAFWDFGFFASSSVGVAVRHRAGQRPARRADARRRLVHLAVFYVVPSEAPVAYSTSIR